MLRYGEWGIDMKKFRRILIAFVTLYIVTSSLMYYVINQDLQRQNNSFRVEINRAKDQIVKEGLWREEGGCNKAIQGSNWVQRVYYLSSQEENPQVINQFYEVNTSEQIEIIPLYSGKQIQGFLRFDYEKSLVSRNNIIYGELILLLFFLFLMTLLIIIYRKIIKPFQELQAMPYELSRGNLSYEIKESKSRFFGKFVWGLGMLKDSLDSHKIQELRLVKDKKMILLSISHDIKTPINAINLYAKAIERGVYQTDEEMRKAAVQIQRKTEEVNEFVNKIVQSSTEDVVTIDVKQGEFYLKELVDKVRMGYQEKCQIQKIQFNIGSYENYLLKGDIDRIYEACGNLIENAVKYGDGIKLWMNFEEEEYCQLITIGNTGNPVEERDMVHLFDSFYRGSNSEGKPGNGLGLYICHEILKKCGGDIYAKKQEHGMEFVLVLPQS